MVSAATIRQKYLDFFKAQKHVVVPSAPLVPENDPTTLFTSSGMQPMMPYLLGQPHPSGTRIADSQKCFRAQDIEEVGDNRHETFFEMLGNWSFGDYFKKEQLAWFLEFLTKELGLAKEKLSITIFEGNSDVPKDEETVHIWKSLGISSDRIFPYSATKNWWSRAGEPKNMPTGEPGGPDSEVFFEFTNVPHNPKFGKTCHPNCDCGRFLEIGNSVFMQYKKEADGSLSELSQKNIDFGGGFERIIAAINNDPDVFNTDLFSDIIKAIEHYTEKSYQDDTNKQAMRVIADHLKASTFLVIDGVVPSNKTQGYILRRLLRRAAIKMRELKGELAPVSAYSSIITSILKTYEGTYFELPRDLNIVIPIISEELEKFNRALDKGLKEIQKMETVSGKQAFDLYQSYGFPVEITAELLQQKGKQIDIEEFKKEFEKHRQLSRTVSTGMFKGGLADHSEAVTKYHTATHLLHAALRKTLGEHIQQKGSNLTGERMRFDFSHPTKLSDSERQQVEQWINEQIRRDLPISMKTESLKEAQEEGALAFFSQKYGDKVSVYSIGDVKTGIVSKEVCGGPHVARTGKLGAFKLGKDESVGAGVRRLYATL